MQLEGDNIEGDNIDRELFCDVVTRIRAQLVRLIHSEVSDLLVNENAVLLEADNFVSKAIRAASGQGTSWEACYWFLLAFT